MAAARETTVNAREPGNGARVGFSVYFFNLRRTAQMTAWETRRCGHIDLAETSASRRLSQAKG